MVVEVTANPVFQAGVPRVLFQAPPAVSALPTTCGTVAPDGKRFLFAGSTAQTAQAPFNVVLNWQAALKR